jgi:hypothetical protein
MQKLTGTVCRVDLEGGFFGIVTDEGEDLYPVDLPDAFKKDGTKIRFAAESAAVFTMHMWGRPVTVRDIERLDT